MKKIIPLTLAVASALLISGLSAVGKEKGSSSATDLFDGPLLDAKGTEVSKEALAGKTIVSISQPIGALLAALSLRNWSSSVTPTRKTSKSCS